MNYVPKTIEKTIVAGTPVRVSATDLFTPGVIIIEARLANAGNVYWQTQAAATTSLRNTLVPGQREVISVQGGGASFYNLADFYLDGDTNDDKVAVTYHARR